ncbi:MAG: hypothetical protein Kow00127_13970 [Bacteroidales bacterium]
MGGLTFQEIKELLSVRRVGIAGAGGLGSNCAVALARVGIGELVVADFDVVSESNLNRQFYFVHQVGQKKVKALADNLRMVNPDVRVVTIDKKLTGEDFGLVFQGCDVLVEAFDLADQKAVMIEAVLEQMPGIPLVCGLGMAGWGDFDMIHLRKSGNLYICGDEASEIAPDCPPIAPRVGIVANMQANMVLEILLNRNRK